jgi:Flp pilus assembly protein protease CpaA
MRKKTVKLGLNYVLTGMVLVIIATFFHEEVAWLFSLSPGGEARFTFLGLFIGGMGGGFGVLIVAIGLLQGASLEKNVYILPTLVILAALLLLFFMLLYSSFENPEPTRVRPGETITI